MYAPPELHRHKQSHVLVHVLTVWPEIWHGIKFGGLAVYITTTKLKFAKISYLHIYIWQSRTEPPNFKSANILVIAILGSTAKFNSRQYFQLYGIIIKYFSDLMTITCIELEDALLYHCRLYMCGQQKILP